MSFCDAGGRLCEIDSSARNGNRRKSAEITLKSSAPATVLNANLVSARPKNCALAG
jgi:hypothetical protein